MGHTVPMLGGSVAIHSAPPALRTHRRFPWQVEEWSWWPDDGEIFVAVAGPVVECQSIGVTAYDVTTFVAIEAWFDRT